ncbi:MAG: hypothetical protein ACFE91_06060 [Promethearchaeota archaeon]
MEKKNIIGIATLIIFVFSLIITVPITFLTIVLSPYGIIDESYSFSYEPISPSTIEKLYITADVGNIEIRYIDPADDYYALIDVYFMMSGVKLARKSYEDYFNIQWNKSSSPANFTIQIISDDWFNPSLWLTKDVNIVVNLRRDVIFDISTIIKKGNLNITVPWGVYVNNIHANVIDGHTFYDFNQCVISGDVSANITEGNFNLRSYNMEYTQNCNWLLNIIGGDMNIEIYQYKEMGANITGTAIISTGVINLFYHDSSANIGAKLYFPLSWWYIPTTQPGFESTILVNGFFYKSNDFPTNSNYNISFYHLGGQGPPNHFIEINSD